MVELGLFRVEGSVLWECFDHNSKKAPYLQGDRHATTFGQILNTRENLLAA